MEQKTVTSIATGKSKDLIKKSNKLEKNGEMVDWDKVFEQVHTLEPKTTMGQINAIREKHK